MPIADRLAWLIYVLLWLVVVIVAGVVVRDAFVGGWPFGAKVDPQTGTAVFSVETDAGTGCQYVVTPWGGIMPRTGPDGRQLCPKPH